MARFKLTNENYYTPEANKRYMSVSQFKEFAGNPFKPHCESAAFKKYKGEIAEEKTTPLLVGSYVDSYFEGTLDRFREENPDIYKKTGDKGLKAEYVQAEEIIERINRDPLFTEYMSGQKQVIMTAKLFDVDWKIKMDSYHPGKMIVDLKVMKDMEPAFSKKYGHMVDFIRYYGYDIQGAIYQAVVEKKTKKKLPFYIACATKEATTNIELIEIEQEYLDKALDYVRDNIQRVLSVKEEVEEPRRCGKCPVCRESKLLKKPITLGSIIPYKEIETGVVNDGSDFEIYMPDAI